jgi:quercetin dioxygenase-like cupin family protein
MEATIINKWQEKIVYGDDGPQPQVLIVSPKIKSVLVGLKAGQIIPAHPAPAAVYHFLQGSGTILVNDQPISVQAGATVVVPDGVPRGIEAKTQMAFLGTHSGEG